MNTTNPFWGLTTALVTPFEWTWNQIHPKIDYNGLTKIIRMQMNAWVNNILLLWTTWENPTLNMWESHDIVTNVIRLVDGRANIIVNTWTNSTEESQRYMNMYNDIAGIDGYLLVNPYYNKPTQAGMHQHFTHLASNTDRPIMLYNIEGRTGVNLETSTLRQIVSDAPNVMWVKEASGDIDQMQEVLDTMPDDFVVASWDDGLTRDLIRRGGHWVVSVASNIMPANMQEFVNACISWEPVADELAAQYQKVFDILFCETNPQPVKTLLANRQIIEPGFRSPMTQMEEENRQRLLDVVWNLDFDLR